MLEHYRDAGWIDEEMINRVPSAGLWEGQTDEQELGKSYTEMEPAILSLLKQYSDVDEDNLNPIERFVWGRHLAHKHKHVAPPVVALRKDDGRWIRE